MKNLLKIPKASKNQKKKIQDLIDLSGSIPKIPSEKYFQQFLGASPETTLWFSNALSLLVSINPYGSIAQLIEFSPLIIKVLFAFTLKSARDSGLSEEEVKELALNIYAETKLDLYSLGNFVGRWKRKSEKTLLSFNLDEIFTEQEKKGNRFDKEALLTCFSNVVFLNVLFNLLEDEYSITERSVENNKEYRIFQELFRFEIGEINEDQLSNTTYNLPQPIKEYILSKHSLFFELYNFFSSSEHRYYLKNMVTDQNSETFFGFLIDACFEGLLKFVETKTGSKESKYIALQPFFERVQIVQTFEEWAKERERDYGTRETYVKEYRTYLSRKIGPLVTPPCP